MAEIYALKEPLKVKLKGPTGEREEVITQLTLDLPEDGKMRAVHLRATDGHSGRVGMCLALISYFSGQPIKVLDQLVDVDLLPLMDLVEDFRKPGQPTGGTV
ncbi:MAG: hypothetical protein GC145_18560 [Caulobacter sp.]|nr:hypothetical protein [Caulobacter sp.]